jgi:hypothetical protein
VNRDPAASRDRVFDLALVAIAFALFVTVIYVSMLAAYQHGDRSVFPDWRTYSAAVHRWLEHEPIFAAQQLAGPYQLPDVLLVGYAYPPPSLFFFLPFASYPWGLVAYLIANLGGLVCVLWAMVSRWWPRRRLRVFAFVLAGLAAWPPFSDGVTAANVNIGIAALVGVVALGLPPTMSGVIGAVAGLVKVFPGASAIATSDRKMHATIVAATIAAAFALLSLPLIGINAWIQFPQALANGVPDCTRGREFGPACLLTPVVGVQVAKWTCLAVGVVATLSLVRLRDPLAMAAMLTVTIMAPAYDLHLHYWILVYVLLVAIAARATATRARGPRDVAAAV